MRSKESSVDLRDKTVSRYRSEEGYQKMSASVMISKKTLAPIILKWKTFGTTKSLPRAGRPAKLSNRKSGEWSLTELQSSSVEMRELFRRTTISASLHQSGLYGSEQMEATPL
jgi:hypothetical protein